MEDSTLSSDSLWQSETDSVTTDSTLESISTYTASESNGDSDSFEITYETKILWLIKLHYGPYESFGSIRHRPQRLRTLQEALVRAGYAVQLVPSQHWDMLQIEIASRNVFQCRLTFLEFSGNAESDPVLVRAMAAIEDMIGRLRERYTTGSTETVSLVLPVKEEVVVQKPPKPTQHISTDVSVESTVEEETQPSDESVHQMVSRILTEVSLQAADGAEKQSLVRDILTDILCESERVVDPLLQDILTDVTGGNEAFVAGILAKLDKNIPYPRSIAEGILADLLESSVKEESVLLVESILSKLVDIAVGFSEGRGKPRLRSFSAFKLDAPATVVYEDLNAALNPTLYTAL